LKGKRKTKFFLEPFRSGVAKKKIEPEKKGDKFIGWKKRLANSL